MPYSYNCSPLPSKITNNRHSLHLFIMYRTVRTIICTVCYVGRQIDLPFPRVYHSARSKCVVPDLRRCNIALIFRCKGNAFRRLFLVHFVVFVTNKAYRTPPTFYATSAYATHMDKTIVVHVYAGLLD